MSIKYVCDVCLKDFDTQICNVCIDRHKPDFGPLTFDVCKDCLEKKLLKPVKKMMSVCTIRIPVGEGCLKLKGEEEIKAELIQIDKDFGRDKTGENRNTYRAKRLNRWLQED